MRFRPRLSVRVTMGVVAIAAVVMTVAIQVGRARGSAREEACSNNLKQIGLALHNYHDANGYLPPGTLVHDEHPVERRWSWMVIILVYLDQLSLLFESDSPSDVMGALMVGVDFGDDDRPTRYVPFNQCRAYGCPAVDRAADPLKPVPADYVGIAGLGPDAPTLPAGHPRAGVFSYDRSPRFADIRDGLAHTAAVSESSDRLGPWTQGGPATVRGVDPARRPHVGRGRPFGGPHRSGTLVLMVDGSVRAITPSADPKMFEAMATIAGGEAVE